MLLLLGKNPSKQSFFADFLSPKQWFRTSGFPPFSLDAEKESFANGLWVLHAVVDTTINIPIKIDSRFKLNPLFKMLQL
jgi:hypothetical protein